MKVLITGATSFIGRHIIKELLLNNFEITAIIREDSNKKGMLPSCSNLKIVELNMEKYMELSTQIIDESFDCVIHLAWNGTRGDDRNNDELQEKNYRYSIDLLEETIKLGCKKFISAGSQAEYGPCNEVVTEETVCNPNTAYGREKLAFYKTAQVLCKERNVTFIEPRFFSLYGADDYKGTMVISTLTKMLKNMDCDLTEGIQMWDFLNIDDAVKAIVALVRTENANGVFNIGSGCAKPLCEYLKEMKRYSKSSSVLKFGAIPYPKTGMVTIQPDVSKLKRQTGWEPKVSFEDGIKDIIKQIRKEVRYEENQYNGTNL